MHFDDNTQRISWWTTVGLETIPFVALLIVFVRWVIPVSMGQEAWSNGAMSLYVLALVLRAAAWWATIQYRWWGYRLIALDLLLVVFFVSWWLIMKDIPTASFLMFAGVPVNPDLPRNAITFLLVAIVCFKTAAVFLFPMIVAHTINRTDERAQALNARWQGIPEGPGEGKILSAKKVDEAE